MKRECLKNCLEYILNNRGIFLKDVENNLNYSVHARHACFRFLIHNKFIFQTKTKQLYISNKGEMKLNELKNCSFKG